MPTPRGLAALALGICVYGVGWAFGAVVLYPVGVGLAIAVLAAVVWVHAGRRPLGLRRRAPRELVAGESAQVELELEPARRAAAYGLLAIERLEGLGEHEIVLRRRGRVLRGRLQLERVPRGRYAFGPTELVAEDPFGLARRAQTLVAPGALLAYPRLVELRSLFSEAGGRRGDGRRLVLSRPSGFDLHSVRDHAQGESLRRVHWPSTAKRGKLMVKELEDSPRDEILVLLDCDATAVAGDGAESSFELAVSAAGSILLAHAMRGKRAALLVASLEPAYQAVQSLDGDWHRALELLAQASANRSTPVASLLGDGAGPAARALELCVVTSALDARLGDRLLQRTAHRRGVALVYVDPTSFAREPRELAVDARAQLARLDHADVPVRTLRRGVDLARALELDDRGREAVG